MLEGIQDCTLCHGLKPQTINRFLTLGRFHNVAEDQLALAPRITGVYDFVNLFALEKFFKSVQLGFGLFNRSKIKVRRDDRKIGEAPFTSFYFVFCRLLEFEKVTHSGSNNIRISLVVVSDFF